MPNPEEYRRTRRIVELLPRIANQSRRWTRRDLAAHHEVSEKQMDKDLRLIRHGLVMPLCHSTSGPGSPPGLGGGFSASAARRG